MQMQVQVAGKELATMPSLPYSSAFTSGIGFQESDELYNLFQPSGANSIVRVVRNQLPRVSSRTLLGGSDASMACTKWHAVMLIRLLDLDYAGWKKEYNPA
jgi:hypothetical protein